MTVQPGRAEIEAAGLGWSVLSAPAGPVAQAFMNDVSPLTFIMGPNGGGKTTACAGKSLVIARRQQPSTKDGVKKVRIGVCRDTYRTLWDTTIPSYRKVFPAHWGKGQGLGYGWIGGKGEPADHRMIFVDQEKAVIDLWLSFRAIGEQNLEDFFKGIEVTGWDLEEVDGLPNGCIGLAASRIGRHFVDELPDPDNAVKCVFGSFNAPDEDNELAILMEQSHSALITRDALYAPDDPAISHRFYLQPSGFSPNAENLQNLGPNWYANQRRLMEDWQVKRFIENKIGFSRHGEPVYRNYDPEQHDLPEHYAVDPRADVVIGIDGGGEAAAVYKQMVDFDRIIALDELVTPKDHRTNGFEFGKRNGEFMASPKSGYLAHLSKGKFIFVIDPANSYGGTEAGQTFMEAFAAGFQQATGFRCRIIPAPTNDPVARQAAVTRPMADYRDGRPRKQITRRCRVLRRAYASGYKLRRAKNAAGDIVYQPVKNEYSHPADADQYGDLYFVGIGAQPARGSGYAGPGAVLPRQQKTIHATAL